MSNFQQRLETEMDEHTLHTPARAELDTILNVAMSNAKAMTAEHGKFRAAQAAYAAILARAAGGEDVPEPEFETAEDALSKARRQVGRRDAIAGIQARAINALLPAAVAETEQMAAAGEVAQ